MFFDLHTHTIYSDGILSPVELIDLSVKRRLDGISITDHDSVGGLDEALSYCKGISDFRIIPGIEFSCNEKSEEIHILGYFIDYKSSLLLDYIDQLRINRLKRTKTTIIKLNNLGIKIDWADIVKKNYNIISRTHIAKELINLQYVYTIEEAFLRYLGLGKPAYVPKESLDVGTTIRLIIDTGGIPVLAHPGLLKEKSTIDFCTKAGILGIECFHSKHKDDETKQFIEYAKKNNLIITGGSDCHGELFDGDYLLGKYFCEIKKGDLLYDYL